MRTRQANGAQGWMNDHESWEEDNTFFYQKERQKSPALILPPEKKMNKGKGSA